MEGPVLITKKITLALFRSIFRNALLVVNHDGFSQNTPKLDRELQLDDEDQDVETSTIYCSCRTAWNKAFIIQCDCCHE